MSINSLQGEVVLKHLEKFLGEPERNWTSELGSFQVLFFPARPDENSYTLVTFGLSAHHFIDSKANSLRLELMFSVDNTFDVKQLAALLIAVGENLLSRHSIPGMHEVLGGVGPVLECPTFEHFYITYPGYFPKEFEICNGLNPAITIAQLIPLSSFERELITNAGWKKFEQLIASENIDLIAFDKRVEIKEIN